MAFVIEETITACFDPSGSGLTMPSWSPGAGEVLLLGVHVRQEGTAVANVAGNGLTWTLVADVDNARGVGGTTVFRASSVGIPSSGSITFDHTHGDPAFAIASRISGVDISVNDGVEAFGTDPGGVTDNDDMQVDVTTITDGALALAFGGNRGDETFDNLPSGQSVIFQSLVDCGSGGDRVRGMHWQEDNPVSPAGLITLGQDNSITGDRPWSAIGLSLKPLVPAGPVGLSMLMRNKMRHMLNR